MSQTSWIQTRGKYLSEREIRGDNGVEIRTRQTNQDI